MDVAKDRLYSEAPESLRRRAVQTVLMNILEVMVRVLAPVLTFTTEEVWQHYPEAARGREGRESSVQLCDWPTRESFVPALPAETEQLEAQWATIMEVRDVVTKALEEARGAKVIKKSQEASVEVTVPAATLAVLGAFDAAVLKSCSSLRAFASLRAPNSVAKLLQRKAKSALVAGTSASWAATQTILMFASAAAMRLMLLVSKAKSKALAWDDQRF